MEANKKIVKDWKDQKLKKQSIQDLNQMFDQKN